MSKYYVYYKFDGGYGTVGMELSSISNMNDIDVMQNKITTDRKLNKVIVVDWKKFEDKIEITDSQEINTKIDQYHNAIKNLNVVLNLGTDYNVLNFLTFKNKTGCRWELNKRMHQFSEDQVDVIVHDTMKTYVLYEPNYIFHTDTLTTVIVYDPLPDADSEKPIGFIFSKDREIVKY